MEDQAIIELYFARSESAISETRDKYGRMLRSISYGILRNKEDAQECENDTYMKTWEQIPPKRPSVFSAFLSKITRNLSLDRYDSAHALKRGGGEVPALLDELAECIPSDESVEAVTDEEELTQIINTFLRSLKTDARSIFLRRYWYGDSVREIARRGGFSMSKVKMSLSRSRSELKDILAQEGYRL